MEGLIDTRNEYIEHIQDILSVAISKRIYAIYTEMMEDKKGLKGFQNELYSIRKWNNNLVNDEYKKIVKYTKCKYLSNLIKIIIITTIKIKIYEYREQFDNIKIKIPNPEDFVHKCYVNAASFSWKNAYLYNRNNIKDAEYQNNLNIIEENIRAIIKKTFRDFVPFDEIFKQIEDNLSENVRQFKENADDDGYEDKSVDIEIAKSDKSDKSAKTTKALKKTAKEEKNTQISSDNEDDEEDEDEDEDEEDEDEEDEDEDEDEDDEDKDEEDEDKDEEDEEDEEDKDEEDEEDDEDEEGDEEDKDEDDEEDEKDEKYDDDEGDDEDNNEKKKDCEEDDEDNEEDVNETIKVVRENKEVLEPPVELEDNKINNIVDTSITKFSYNEHKNEENEKQYQEISFPKSEQTNIQSEKRENKEGREMDPNNIRKEWNNIKGEYSSLSQNKIDYKRYENDNDDDTKSIASVASVASAASAASAFSNITDISQVKKIHIKETSKGKKPTFF